MAKEPRNQIMSKVYREFSRQKYNKYKAQFPKLREAEIVSKIIKEWDALNLAAKQSLQIAYEKNNYLTNEDISSSEALMKADLARKEARVAAEKAAKRPKASKISATHFHANVKAGSRDGSEQEGSRYGQSSSVQVLQKTKPISKEEPQEDYVSFFKRQYKKLSAEHKRWTTTQITKVIKLLWQGKKKHRTVRKSNGRLRTSKPISAYQFYKKTKRLDKKEARRRWKSFPIETRNIWDNRSKEIEIDNTTKRGSAKYGSTNNKPTSFDWMSIAR